MESTQIKMTLKMRLKKGDIVISSNWRTEMTGNQWHSRTVFSGILWRSSELDEFAILEKKNKKNMSGEKEYQKHDCIWLLSHLHNTVNLSVKNKRICSKFFHLDIYFGFSPLDCLEILLSYQCYHMMQNNSFNKVCWKTMNYPLMPTISLM